MFWAGRVAAEGVGAGEVLLVVVFMAAAREVVCGSVWSGWRKTAVAELIVERGGRMEEVVVENDAWEGLVFSVVLFTRERVCRVRSSARVGDGCVAIAGGVY